MKFGDILKELIERTGLTQKEVAAQLNIAASTLGNYTQSSREPDYETLKKIAEYFNVSIDFLLDYRPAQSECNRQEQELLSIYRQMSEDYRALYLAQGKAVIRHQNK